jgi:hypothetical protein
MDNKQHLEETLIASNQEQEKFEMCTIPLPVFVRNGRMAVKKLLESHQISENGLIAGFCGSIQTIIGLWDCIQDSMDDADIISKIDVEFRDPIGSAESKENTNLDANSMISLKINQDSCQCLILKIPISYEFGTNTPDQLIQLPENIMRAIHEKIGKKTILENMINYLTYCPDYTTWVLESACIALLEDQNFINIYEILTDRSDPSHDEEILQDIYNEMDRIEAMVVSFADESALESLYCQNCAKIETLVGSLNDRSLQEQIVTLFYIDVPTLYKRLYEKFV